MRAVVRVRLRSWRPGGLLVWAGIVLLGLVALTATLQAIGDLRLAASRLTDPVVGTGLILAIISLVGIASIVVALARLASTSPRGESLAIGGALVLVVAVRVLVAFLIEAPVDRDMRYYDHAAASILRGDCCFVTRPVGYPVLLAGVYGSIGRGALAGEVLNLGAALAGAVVLAAVVRRSFGGPAAAVTVVLYACWPAGALMTSARMGETVYTSQLLFAVGAVMLGGTGMGWGLITGAILGVSQYVRSTSVALVPVFALAHLVRRPRTGPSVAIGSVALVMGFLAVLTPVIWYNLLAHDELSVATHAYGGLSVWQGSDQASGGRFSLETWEAYPHLSSGDPWQDGKVAARLGWQRIADDPAGFLALQLRKFPFTWGSEDYGLLFAVGAQAPPEARHTFPRLAGQVFYAGVTLIAFLALLSRRRLPLDPLTLLTVGAVLTTAGIHFFLEARERYHMYVVPLIMAIAAVGIINAMAVVHTVRESRSTVPARKRGLRSESPSIRHSARTAGSAPRHRALGGDRSRPGR